MTQRSFDLMDGKYTIIVDDEGGMSFLRYKEPWVQANERWRFVGMIRAAASRIEELEDQVKELKDQVLDYQQRQRES